MEVSEEKEEAKMFRLTFRLRKVIGYYMDEMRIYGLQSYLAFFSRSYTDGKVCDN
jgi:hypothetical protein